nr:retrovirus-related Pol polyprotein from transposon TNT 1-94 [Tanacetum cinerariifolium]
MNGWLIEDEDEPREHEASDKEVDSDLESTASSKPMMKKTTKADHDCVSRNCPYCSKYMENYKNVSQDIRDQLNVEAEAKAIEWLKQGESINVQDLETNLYWEFGKFTSRDGKLLKSYYSRFYKMMNELVRNQCNVTNHQVNVQFLLQLLPEWQRFVTLVKQSQELKIVSYYKLYDILKQHQNEVNEIRAERLACTANPIALVAQQQPRDDTDEEPEDQKLEAHYMYMAQIQEVTPDAADSSKPIFDSDPLQKVSYNDNYNVFTIESKHPEQSKSVKDTYPIEQDEHNVIIDSLYMSYDREQVDQDDDDDLANERNLLTSLIEKLKCEIDDSKNRNKFLETSNKALVDKLKGEIKDFKNKNKSLESSNNHFKEANNELSKTNQLMYKDLKKFQAELDRYNDVKYASKMEIDYEKAKGELMSYKMESEKSFNTYTRKINDLNQTISKMKKKLFAHQETISILSQAKEAQLKFYKTREDKEIDKVIVLENKIKDLDNILYKTGQAVQTMSMLNRNCKTSFVKSEFLKKAQRANPRLYDIGVIPPTSVSRPQLKSNQIEDRVMINNSQGKKQEVEDHRRNVKFSKNKTSVTTWTKRTSCLRINHQMSVARTPEQNGVVERQNRTFVEAARTMLSAAKVPLFFWVEAISTSCFTQNHSLVIPRHEKTPYHIINDQKPSVKFFHIFGSLCYIVKDGENHDKMKEKGDVCIFVGYSTQSIAYRVFNKRTRVMVETIHVNLDELPQMASDHVSSDPVP